MLHFFRNTSLYRQVTELIQAQRNLIQTKHRFSLRLKRASVRSEIYVEILKEQADKARHMKQIALVSSNTQILRDILDMRESKVKEINELLSGIHQEEKRMLSKLQIPDKGNLSLTKNPASEQILSRLRDIVNS